jgi:hypothetical protein
MGGFQGPPFGDFGEQIRSLPRYQCKRLHPFAYATLTGWWQELPFPVPRYVNGGDRTRDTETFQAAIFCRDSFSSFSTLSINSKTMSASIL